MSLPPKRRRSSASHETHIWPLGALAELVATASADSTQLYIDASLTPKPHLTILNNGPGHPLAALTVLTTPSPWRTAALRIGSSLAVLTKLSDGTATVALLTDPPYILHWASMSAHHPHLPHFLQGTPWNSYHHIVNALDSIPSSGSLLIISDLAPNPANPNHTELDFSDPHDIRCPSTSNIRLSSSLRTYLQLLFLRPNAKMHLRGRVVRERHLRAAMWARTDFIYTPRAVNDSVATTRFGFDPHATGEEFGMLIYCHGRLIRPYLRVGLQVPQHSDVRVVGVVEADFLTPTRNNQAFNRDKLYQGLLFSLDRSLKAFWQRYGSMQKVLQKHSRDPVRRWCRCDDCGYWRVVVPREGAPNPDDISCQRWVCAFNLGGTTKCGPPDDEDVPVNVGNRRIFGASRSRPDSHKKLPSPLPDGDDRVADASQPLPLDGLGKPPRVSRIHTPAWPENGVFEESALSSPTTTVGTPAAKLKVTEIAAVGEHFIVEPNLDLDQPTSEHVSPELHLCGDDFSLSRDDILVQPQLVPVSGPSTLPPNSAPPIPSTGRNLARCGQSDTLIQTVEMKGTPARGEVSLLTTNPMHGRQTAQAVRNNLISDPEQKLSHVSTSDNFGGTSLSHKQIKSLRGADTFMSSSSTTHEGAIKDDNGRDKVVSLLAQTNNTNDNICINHSALARHTLRSGTQDAGVSRVEPMLGETAMNRGDAQILASPDLLLTSQYSEERIAQKTTEEEQSHEQAFVLDEGYHITRLPRASSTIKIRDGGNHGVQKLGTTKDGEHDMCGGVIDAKHISGETEAQHTTLPNGHPGADETQHTLSKSVETPRYGGFRYARGSKGKGRAGKCPITNLDGDDLQSGVPTSALKDSARRNVNISDAGSDILADDILRSKRDTVGRGTANGQLENSAISPGDIQGKLQVASGKHNFAALQVGRLDSVDVSKLLDLVQEGEIGKPPQLHPTADAPGLEPTQNRIQRSREEFLLEKSKQIGAIDVPTLPIVLRPLQVAAPNNGRVDHERVETSRNSLQPEVYETRNDQIDSFEKPKARNGPHSFQMNANKNATNIYALKKRQRLNPILEGGKNNSTSDIPSPDLDTAETFCESADKDMASKRRSGNGLTAGAAVDTPLSSGQGAIDGSHSGVGDKRTNSDGSQRGSQNEKRRRVLSDPLAVATEAAASAAQVALGDMSRYDLRGHGTSIPCTDLPMQMTWSHIALSAAVAAGAAAAAATVSRQSQTPSTSQGNRNEEQDTLSRGVAPTTSKGEKLRQIVSLLVPVADAETLNKLDQLDAEGVSREITHRIKQVARKDAEQAVSKQLESCRSKLQTETKALRKVRKLVHIFLDKVVGILQTDDSHEPIENQLESYLRLVDALPSDNSN